MGGSGLNKTARELMNPRVVTASRGTNVEILARQLLSEQLSGLPVVEPDGEVVGVVTEFDLLKALQGGKDLKSLKAGEIMTTPPLCIVEDTSLVQILQKMIDHKVIRLPVVRNRKLVGVISRADILSQLVDWNAPMTQVLPLCYWCEKVRDDIDSQPGQGIWCDFHVYLQRYQMNSHEVSFTNVFCPTCSPLVKSFMSEQSLRSTEI